ncbi:Long-chain-fatty-acid--CoA ligase FadD15 [bioreactor metagenome]|uniref:Long-chain-fatty-acid--CoA ligase FadD15 n=1 Tax=bioreactor metagenome TaxID=1076179 RepID=A0A645CEH5_9ZZZZ
MIDKEDPNASYGEIVVRGGNIMLGYYGDAEATAAAIEDGWFRTGDYGYLDEDGYLYITGRKKNVIVLNNGKNVFPEEIESYLEKVQLIAENVIIGKANESGETYGITALIFPDFTYAASIGLTDIVDISEAIKDQIAKLNKSLPSFKQIRGIEIRKTEFDKTTSHKIKRHTVKAENQ